MAKNNPYARLYKHLLQKLEYCEDVLKEKALQNNLEYKYVMEMPKSDLPLYINAKGITQKLVGCNACGTRQKTRGKDRMFIRIW